eukprot:TRINITY_DN3080_c0_g2_i1.p1 TRINITY_DN3080_c0_g2~~TRINITY_DN3080_c0_g2_i1.p1  ORF type:complete len:642 (+),score=133.01 TRINITY_DN3080_c0_g2_i1:110-2035(+)
MKSILLFTLLCTGILADIYLHNPRGSNNRLNSQNENTRNNNRMFDSQNNDAGGYLVGPKMFFYSQSLLQLEWTAQHSCGPDNKAHCNLVIQYMCSPEVRDGARDEDNPALGNNDLIQQKNNNPNELLNNGDFKFGQHETPDYFQACDTRERNKGLFTADQNLNNDVGARATRQNPGGTQRGFECPEERDYYPYWHPTPWKDIAVLVSSDSLCDYYKKQSQNVRTKNYCSSPNSNFRVDRNNWKLPPFDAEFDQYNNRLSCESAGGKWQTYPAWGISPPDCQLAEWSRDNHLGNVRGTDTTATYLWILPDVSRDENTKYENCALRVRYNISTSDYAPWGGVDSDDSMVDASVNGKEKSPVVNDPDLLLGGFNKTLAVNTAQFGRTFEDRSHTFSIRSRHNTGIDSNARIYNLNVRGKRGNIVQAFPSVEYDFTPNDLRIKLKDYVHFQWTGSDNNPQNYDGEGKAGTDRSNIVQIKNNDGRGNIPSFISQDDVKTSDRIPVQTMFDSQLAKEFAHLDQPTTFCATAQDTDCCKTYEQLENSNNRDNDDWNCNVLNAASPYFERPPVQFDKPAKYHYMSTRNNNFSNRSQKGTITVEAHIGWVAAAAIVVGSIAFLAAMVIAFGAWWAASHPGSAAANVFQRV